MTATQDFKDQLRAAYDADALRRVGNTDKRSDWKLAAREAFAKQAKAENKKSILELGAGAGLDAKYFVDQGFDVLATDLSPKMVDACKELGLDAQVLDLYELDGLGQKFDAIYSINVLLHIPPQDLGQILVSINNCLLPGDLFYYGAYGGVDKEEVTTDQTRMNMPRYFAFLSDESQVKATSELFDIISFEVIDLKGKQDDLHFQSLLLRKKA